MDNDDSTKLSETVSDDKDDKNAEVDSTCDTSDTLPKQENPEEKKPSFWDIAFTKNEKGEYVTKIVEGYEGDKSAESPIEKKRRDPYYSKKPRQFVARDSLTIHKAMQKKNPWKALDGFVSLKGLKAQIMKIERLIEFDRKRIAAGLPVTSHSHHLVFTGNPGTGKTQTARILGSILKKAGVLSIGHVVEVDRSDLAMGYIGQTAIKTREILDVARGGILLVDEAQTLDGGFYWDFGYEALATIQKYMEDNRDDLIVIFAGHKDEMSSFLSANQGLKSRIKHYIDFADYTPDELFEIFMSLCKEYKYVVQDDAAELLKKLFRATKGFNPQVYGNARFARNVFEKTLEKMASRVIELKLKGKVHLRTIRFTDIPLANDVLPKEHKKNIG